MRCRLPLLIGCGVTLLLIGCATSPRRSAVHYSPPSVAPARQKITNAQGHAKAAKAAIVKAEKLAPANLPKLSADLTEADHEIDELTDELLNAQSALTELENKNDHQTDLLNAAIDDKNAALDQNAIIERKVKSIVHQRNKLFLILCGALAWIFRGPLIWLAKFLFALISKIPI
jgi:septal ring factor EnvC (AmiA/AmiB activator)